MQPRNEAKDPALPSLPVVLVGGGGMTLPDCVCGAFLVYVNGRPMGTWFHLFDEEGRVLESSTDGVYAVLSSVVWCPDCGKKRSDLRCTGRRVVVR